MEDIYNEDYRKEQISEMNRLLNRMNNYLISGVFSDATSLEELDEDCKNPELMKETQEILASIGQ